MTLYRRVKRADFVYPSGVVEPTVRRIERRDDGIIGTIMDKLPLAIIAIGAATGLFGYAKFIITGGYGEAISRFKEFGFFSFSSDVFVKSTAGYPYNKFVLIPVLIMLTAALIYCFRLMFSTSDRKGIKILSIVMLIAPIVMMAAMVVLQLTGNGLSGDMTGYIGIAMMAMIIGGFVIIGKDRNAKEYAKEVRRSAMLYFIGIPVLVWLLENLIGFGSIVIGFLLAGAAIYFIGGLLTTGDSDGGSAVSGGSSGGSSGGFSGGASASGRSDSKSRDLKKKQERLDYLRKQAGEYEYYNMRQAEGAVGYQHFSAAKNREVIRDLNKEASYLEKEIAKMNK